MTVPPPYWPLGMTPSKPPYSMGWSSTCDGEALVGDDVAGALGDGPAFEHAVPAEAEVVVQVRGGVLLDDEGEVRGGLVLCRLPEPLGSAVILKSRMER